MTTIKNHSNPKYFTIQDATDEMIKKATEISKGNWARVTGTTLLVHVSYRSVFENMLEKASRNEAVAPTFEDDTEMGQWLWDHINNAKIASVIEQNGCNWFNEWCAGKTAETIEKENQGYK